MLFEDQDRNRDMAPKQIPVTFKCDEQFRDWLGREAAMLDMSVSEVVRASLLLAVPQMKSIHGIARIQLEDMRSEQDCR